LPQIGAAKSARLVTGPAVLRPDIAVPPRMIQPPPSLAQSPRWGRHTRHWLMELERQQYLAAPTRSEREQLVHRGRIVVGDVPRGETKSLFVKDEISLRRVW
jgi:hypothetical protein